MQQRQKQRFIGRAGILAVGSRQIGGIGVVERGVDHEGIEFGQFSQQIGGAAIGDFDGHCVIHPDKAAQRWLFRLAINLHPWPERQSALLQQVEQRMFTIKIQ
ncbi:hypothetical protein D3C81_1504420 [compost metagenome]